MDLGSGEGRAFFLGHVVLDSIARNGEFSDWTIGGGVIYGACAAALTGLDVAVVSVVGRDFPMASLARLRDLGIEMRDLIQSDGETTRFLLRYRGSGTRQLVLRSQALPIQEEQLPSLDHSLLVACPVFHEMPESEFLSAAKRAREIHLDPQGFCRDIDSEGQVGGRTWRAPRLSNLKTLKFSLEELSAIRSSTVEGRESTLIRMSEELRCDVVLTMGSRGLLAHGSNGLRVRMPAFKVEPERYPTGAGDALLGTYVAKRSAGLGLVESLAHASAVASVHVESNLLSLNALDQELVEERARWILDRSKVRV